MAPEAEQVDYEQRYNQLLHAASQKLREKESEQKQLATWITIGLAVLLFFWLHNESQRQTKLDNALSDCLVPISDGSCGGRYQP